MNNHRDYNTKAIRLQTYDGKTIPVLILSPKDGSDSIKDRAGVLWIHGGGYIFGFKEMVHFSRAVDLVVDFGCVVVSPGYRRAFHTPYPAAINDCYEALLYLKNHTAELGVRSDQIMVGGESAGGGLTAAVCMMARDRGEVNIAYQMPLYPMLDNYDTESSAHNRGKMWNTPLNHLGWYSYLRSDAKSDVSPYASPSRQTDYSGLPPCYTFVGDGEPFYAETLAYVENLRKAGVDADGDIYHTDVHGFDIVRPNEDISREARESFSRHFAYAKEHYFAEQKQRF